MPSLRRSEEQQIESVIALILGAVTSPPAGAVDTATLKLRRFIDTMASRVKGTARELLREDDPRRVAAEKDANEAIYRAKCVGPGDGLESAFTYCRSLATIAQDLRHHAKVLDQVAEARPDGPRPSRRTACAQETARVNGAMAENSRCSTVMVTRKWT
ncbi:DUF6415 family natural product biosynthesis protein [Streptomyces sp. ET3-23]|uniref:DUF6415 family natural product biosynthesis protein n=1 Tax=Streptomyces sp. ET3-23 TaxID=2885643 RepID=UPI001D11C5EC|nr:DUF6415 family natural product biosynthesis protein [Streptomyces sp. ET3-23]MCC2280578.1 DUF6415 family natural product biosynthesis protein [Streptomyces sp. ET3-23]